MDNLDCILIGFVAQMVDSAVGMAFGTLSSSLLLALGFPPAALSATVHMAEIFSGGFSAFSHWRLKNIDVDLIKKLLLPAIAGAIVGAFLVTLVPGDKLKPWVSAYFVVIGLVIIVKSLKPAWIRPLKIGVPPVGFLGGFFDGFGGAGWGEFVSSSLILQGRNVRTAVGSLNTVEFAVSLTISLVFASTVGIDYWPSVAALAFGGMLAAPFGAWICKTAPTKALILTVGFVVMIMGMKSLVN